METQTHTDSSEEVQLTPQEQAKIVNAVTMGEKKGKDARKAADDDGNECYNAYICKQEKSEEIKMQWRSNAYLPWCRDAIDATYAYLIANMFPRNEDLFSLKGRTQEDHPGVKVMEEYISYLFRQNDFADQFKKAIKQGLTRNHTAMKGYWRDEKKVTYEWVDGEDGVKRKQPKEITVYNNVWFDVVPLKNFHFFPISGDYNKTLRVHTTWRFKEELLEQAKAGQVPYFNMDIIAGERDDATSAGSFWKPPTESPDDGDKEDKGLKVSEAYFHRLNIDGRIFNNYIATVVNDKTLIRFQPNPYGMGKCPILFTAINPLDDSLVGDGILSPGLSLQYAGNAVFNMKLDELKAKLYGSYVYWDDEVFDADNFLAVPAGLVEMSQESVTQGNLRPVNPHLEHLAIVYSEIAEIKAEFESVTVPPVVKGMLATQDNTATAETYAQNNASGKMHVIAGTNNKILREAVEMTYDLIYQRMQFDPRVKEDIARVTQEAIETITVDADGQPLPEPFTRELSPQELVAKLPQFIPVAEIDIEVIAYQNQVRRQEELVNMERAIPQMMANPEMAALHKMYDTAEAVYESLQLDPERFLVTKEEAAQAQEQQQAAMQQAQALVEEQQRSEIEMNKQKMQLELLKEQHQAVVDEKKLEIEMLKLQMEQQRMTLDHERAQQDQEFRQNNPQEKKAS